jgi:preprotein translocase subunit Sss1
MKSILDGIKRIYYNLRHPKEEELYNMIYTTGIIILILGIVGYIIHYIISNIFMWLLG